MTRRVDDRHSAPLTRGWLAGTATPRSSITRPIQRRFLVEHLSTRRSHPERAQSDSARWRTKCGRIRSRHDHRGTHGDDRPGGVSYATSNKTAYSGSEYTTTNGTLTFASGETSKTFSVPIIDDVTVDGKKTLTLTLSAPTGGAILGTITSPLNIADNEVGSFGSGSFMFSKSEFDATEGDGIATLTVNRVGGTLHTVSVNYDVQWHRARPGWINTTTSGTPTFEAVNRANRSLFPFSSDLSSDSGEYFTVSLSLPRAGLSSKRRVLRR